MSICQHNTKNPDLQSSDSSSLTVPSQWPEIGKHIKCRSPKPLASTRLTIRSWQSIIKILTSSISTKPHPSFHQSQVCLSKKSVRPSVRLVFFLSFPGLASGSTHAGRYPRYARLRKRPPIPRWNFGERQCLIRATKDGRGLRQQQLHPGLV